MKCSPDAIAYRCDFHRLNDTFNKLQFHLRPEIETSGQDLKAFVAATNTHHALLSPLTISIRIITWPVVDNTDEPSRSHFSWQQPLLIQTYLRLTQRRARYTCRILALRECIRQSPSAAILDFKRNIFEGRLKSGTFSW